MTTPDSRLQWGILGTGLIAREFADGILGSQTGRLVACGSRAPETAQAFAAQYNIPHAHGSYEDLLADPDVQAVYIATPHPSHAKYTIKAARAGKHILVEKPIGLNYAEAVTMVDAARENGVFLMEAFMYRCHPQMARLVELIQSGAIGQVRMIRASFSYHSEAPLTSRTFAQELGGGGILDVGCYPVSAARLIAGAALGQAFAEPLELKGCAHLGATGVDEWAVAVARFPGDILAELSTGVRLNLHTEQVIEVFGADGKITVPDPWTPSRYNRDPVRIIVKRHDAEAAETILVEAPHDLYTYEADMVANHIAAGEAPAMSHDDTLGNMRVLDAWRREVGLVYEQEQPAAMTRTITGASLAVAQQAMRYGHIAGLAKPLSRLVLGADANHTMPETAYLFDDYFERGGNAFDTSYGYGAPNGACERNLGQWVKNRGIRDRVVIIEKGGNFPNNTPEGLTRELQGGLERLQIDRADIYMLHRDNEAVPVGEWVEVLNEHLRAGRMTVFGLSNFSIARLQEFHDYAERRGLSSFGAVSNQCSLARVLAPIWDMHLVSSSDAESRAWFAATQTPLIPWSSQARGFFTPRAAPGDLTDPELVRCWYSEANFARKARAEELARRRGVEPINIALAWVLCQPFPTFPLVGARRPAETRSSLRALDIHLSPDEIAWLDGH